MGFPRQEYWSGLPFPSPGDLPEPGIQTLFSVSPALAGEFFTTAPPRKYKLLMNTLKCSNGEYGFPLFFSIRGARNSLTIYWWHGWLLRDVWCTGILPLNEWGISFVWAQNGALGLGVCLVPCLLLSVGFCHLTWWEAWLDLALRHHDIWFNFLKGFWSGGLSSWIPGSKGTNWQRPHQDTDNCTPKWLKPVNNIWTTTSSH